MSKRAHLVLRIFRSLHLYIGAFTAPALVFFALSGALQTFNFHDSAKDGSYVPPSWVAALGRVHKKQTAVVPPKKATPAAEKTIVSAPPIAPAPPAPDPWPMKAFFLVVAVGLLISTASGVYMSYKFTRNGMVITALIVAGVVVPTVMLITR